MMTFFVDMDYYGPTEAAEAGKAWATGDWSYLDDLRSSRLFTAGGRVQGSIPTGIADLTVAPSLHAAVMFSVYQG